MLDSCLHKTVHNLEWIMWFSKLIFLSLSRACNFNSGIFRGVYFPFWQIPIVNIQSFSRVWFFCHFPGCAISNPAFFRLCILDSGIFKCVDLCVWRYWDTSIYVVFDRCLSVCLNVYVSVFPWKCLSYVCLDVGLSSGCVCGCLDACLSIWIYV